MPFSDRLQEAMTFAKKDRKALAGELKVSVQAIGQLLGTGSKSMTAENCAKAARFLGVDLHWLATGEGSKTATAAWPFAKVDQQRFLRLGTEDRSYVEAKLESAIERCEEVLESLRRAQ